MKKVLLITENLGSGGAERQLTGLAVLLKGRGYDTKVITYCHNQFFEPYLEANHVEYELVPKLKNKFSRPLLLVGQIKKEKPDVVISFLPGINIACCLAKLFTKFKLVVSERNNNVAITLKDKVQFNIYRIADFIVPNSHSQGEFIKNNFSFLSQKVIPIVNFVDVSDFELKKTWDNKDDIRIVTVARYSEQKNCLRYLRAIRKIKDAGINVHFDWFGGHKAYQDYYDKINNSIKELKIDDFICLHDATDKVVEVYHSADIFCLPSLYEGYPNVVCEAMSCGLPVVCSNVYENPRIVEEGVNGFLFNPENIDDMAAALMKMISLTNDERQQMGLNNRKRVEKNNSMEVFVGKYESLF